MNEDRNRRKKRFEELRRRVPEKRETSSEPDRSIEDCRKIINAMVIFAKTNKQFHRNILPLEVLQEDAAKSKYDIGYVESVINRFSKQMNFKMKQK